MTEQEREEAIEELLCYADCFISWTSELVNGLSPLASQADLAVEEAEFAGRKPVYVTLLDGQGQPDGGYGSWCATDALEAAYLLMEGWEPGEEVVRL